MEPDMTVLAHTYIVSEYNPQLPDLVLDINGVQPGNRGRGGSERKIMCVQISQ